MDIHNHNHCNCEAELVRVSELLFLILRKLNKIDIQGEIIMADFTDVEAAVAADTDAVNSAITLLTSLADEVEATGGDQDKVTALAAEIRTNTATLASAVAANTPAAPPVDTPPVDTPPVDTPPVDTPPAQ